MNRDSSKKGSSGNFRPSWNRFGDRDGRSFRRDNFNSGPREKHKAICDDCKKECEVPFKPTEGRAVFCMDCYPKHKKFQ